MSVPTAMTHLQHLNTHESVHDFLWALSDTHAVFREYQYRMAYPRVWHSGMDWFFFGLGTTPFVCTFRPPLWMLSDTPVRYVMRVFDMSLRRALNAIKQVEVNLTAPECPNGILEETPTLWEFLSVTAVDGKSRQTSTMSVWVSDGGITLCLNERDAGLSLYSGGSTFEAALRSMEAKLNSETPEWRKGYTGAGKKRK